MADRLLTKAETREGLRIGAKKLDELIRAGDLEIIRFGRRTIRVAEDAVRQLLERRTERGR
jgi:excisionase family DNA binding protein